MASQLGSPTYRLPADLGYVGVEGIEIVPFKRLPSGELTLVKPNPTPR